MSVGNFDARLPGRAFFWAPDVHSDSQDETL